MAAKQRDEFSESIKRTTAERAGYRCSNPSCRRPTVGPHTVPDKSIKTGEACHICAAAPGGPRYDPTQTPVERSSIANAIWLCTECSTKVDRDPLAFPVDMLLGWKQRHEDLVRGETNGPSLPTIELSTVRGLLVPDGDSDVSGEDCEIFRDHILVFSNRHDIELQNIQARIQLPEPVVGCQLTYRPVGIEVSWGPERIQSVAYATGSGSVTQRGPSRPKRTQILQIERLSPQSNIELAFRTAKDRFHGLSPVFTVGSDPKDVNSFVLGTFTTSCYGVTQVQEFFAPIAYDDANRQLHAMDVYGDHTDWNVQLITEYL